MLRARSLAFPLPRIRGLRHCRFIAALIVLVSAARPALAQEGAPLLLTEPGPRLASTKRRWLPSAPPPRAVVGTITGTVTAARTREPLAGATIQVEGTSYGAVASASGAFRIAHVPAGSHTISARILGYAKVSRQATVTDGGTASVDFALERAASQLDALVVTDTPLGSSKRELGNSVGIVNAADIIALAPPPNVQQLLNNVPGVRVQSAGGDVGSGGNTRILGASSMTLSSEPLLYIDGVRVNNAAADNGGVPGFATGIDSRAPPSRINDVNPDETESIEIVKGPAAATLYGTEASNGVINILTKKGVRGRATVTYQVDQGANWLPNPEALLQHSYYKTAAGEIVDANVLAHDRLVGFPVSHYGRCPKPHSQSGDVCKGTPFSAGHPQAFNGAVSGGVEGLNYYFFGGFDRDEGAVSYNWKNRLSGRSHLTYTPNTKVSIDFGLSYTGSRLRAAGAQQPTASRRRTTTTRSRAWGQLVARHERHIRTVPRAWLPPRQTRRSTTTRPTSIPHACSLSSSPPTRKRGSSSPKRPRAPATWPRRGSSSMPLHTAAGIPAYDAAGTDEQNQVITQVIEERRRELFTEGGHRLNDQLRFRATPFNIPFKGEPGSIHPNGVGHLTAVRQHDVLSPSDCRTHRHSKHLRLRIS